MTKKENKRKNYMAKAIIDVVDHLLKRLTEENMEIVLKVKLQKKEDEDEGS